MSVFVDHGLMRKGEPESVRKIFGDMLHMNLVAVDATDRFLDKLAGVGEPERKRKIIGEEFIRVFEEEAEKIGDVRFLAQGTIYPDIIESKSGKGGIKSHHNVGVCRTISILSSSNRSNTCLRTKSGRRRASGCRTNRCTASRSGPGLGVRAIGAVTREKSTWRESDAILREEVKNAGLEGDWQYFTACPGFLTVGVRMDARVRSDCDSRRYSACHRRCLSHAADAAAHQQPHTQEVEGVNRVVYDITPNHRGRLSGNNTRRLHKALSWAAGCQAYML